MSISVTWSQSCLRITRGSNAGVDCLVYFLLLIKLYSFVVLVSFVTYSAKGSGIHDRFYIFFQVTFVLRARTIHC